MSETEVTQNDNLSTSKSIELSAGLSRTTITDSYDEDIDANGITLSVGESFPLGSNISTTSSLIGNYAILDSDAFESETLDASIYDIGLSQRLSYSFNNSGFIIKPFVEVGASVGSLSYDITDGSDEAEVKFNYTSLKAALGIQLELSTGLTPFVKLETASLNLAYRAEVSSTIDGVSLSTSIEIDNDETELTNTALTVGVGYYF